MHHLKIATCLLFAKLSLALGSNLVTPALTPAVPVTSYALPSPYSPAFVPNLAPFVPRSFVPQTHVIAPGSVSYPGALVPTGYAASSPLLPGPFAFQPRSVHAVAPAPLPGPVVPTGYAAPSPLLPAPFALQARSVHAVAPVAPALPPVAVAR